VRNVEFSTESELANCVEYSVWRVLKGPNNDWPLALLDYETINFENDPILNDIVYENSCGENELIMANDKHRWYYLSDQSTDDLIIFRQSSTVRFDVPSKTPELILYFFFRN
jgi:hypothetical protein